MYKINSYLISLLLLITGQFAFAQLPMGVPSLAPMLRTVTPAVVNISSSSRSRVSSPLFNDPFFRHFFDLPDVKEKKEQSRGSGVIINARKGYVLTNNHVIAKATKIAVTLRDGRKYTAKLIGADPETDVALLKIPAQNLTAIPLANSDRLEVGDFVVAIGNPFGLGQTVTSGIVSALGRTGLGIEGYEDFIQTDASINPGNSGGALVDLRGKLVGINTAILAPNGNSVGIGFAIPSNMVSQVVKHLVRYGEVRRGSLGIHIQQLNPQLARAFGVQGKKGGVIAKVLPGSAASKAGLRSSDVIIAINNKPVKSAADIRNRIGLLSIGERVRIRVIRKRRTYNFTAVIADNRIKGRAISNYLQGLSLKDTSKGIKVVKVTKNTTAGKIGFLKGDFISGFNGRKLKQISELKRMFKYINPRSLQVQRNNRLLSVQLK
ncbi:Do family serine endopeptidase [Candidatus Marithrix sp. Canyon 246]|uniref:Do family serine endopeptidase n=1 Tax=Candidatus Marithrix sp. Canyon 246 TaxID=1827136 RepID=UPI00084A12C8|nr:Do family serine endopeptidase [Candidatus Marithrix sp. Canyon 246]